MTRALFIGRFQPPHNGHLAVIRDLAAAHAKVIVGIGSAFDSHTAKNPFTSGERFRMLEDACEDAGLTNVTIVPIPDLNRNALWVKHVESILPPFDVFVSNNPLPRRLFTEAGYALASVPLRERETLEGTRIREAMTTSKEWEPRVPPAVARVLIELGATKRLADLATRDSRAPG